MIRAAILMGVLAMLPSVVQAECIPSTLPTASEEEKTLASIMCRNFRAMGAVKSKVATDKRGLVMELFVSDPEVAEAFGKPELAKEPLAEFLAALPDMWKASPKPLPRTVHWAVWTMDPTDRRPRVVWTRKGGPTGELTVATGDGLFLDRP